MEEERAKRLKDAEQGANAGLISKIKRRRTEREREKAWEREGRPRKVNWEKVLAVGEYATDGRSDDGWGSSERGREGAKHAQGVGRVLVAAVQ